MTGEVKTNYVRHSFIIGQSCCQGIPMPTTRLLPYIEVFFAVVVWGASFIATKVALADAPPITIVWLRFTMGIIILGITVALRKQFALPSKNEWGYFEIGRASCRERVEI